jgi:hypothetical protein
MSEPIDPSELEWLLCHYRLGALDETGCERLETLLRSSEEARRLASRYLMTDVMLRHELRVAEVSRLFTEEEGANWWADMEVAPDCATLETAPRVASPRERGATGWAGSYTRWAIPVLTALLLSMVATNVVLQSRLHDQSQRQGVIDREAQRRAESVATLVDSTLCLWDVSTLAAGESSPQLSPNTGLRLLEGIAAIELEGPHVGDASLQIEGPASWLFTDDGQLRLSYGKLTVDASTGDQILSIDTPMGRVHMAGHGSLGVSCFGNDLEIHAFSGRARIDSLWVDETTPGGMVEVSAGEMVRLSIHQDSPYLIMRDVADASRFASRLSMATDDLKVNGRYVDAVKSDRPLGYWRFESIRDSLVANEIAGGQPLRVSGAVELRGNDQNQYAEFVDSLADEHIEAKLITDEPISNEELPEYSVEIWVKPSHYQQASIVGLVAGPLDDYNQSRHGMLLELAGPHPPVTSMQHPGRVRYLNRFPAARHPAKRESVFSQNAYELRRWQHVVVVKDREHKRLYINGELQAEALDSNPLSGGLSVLVGRLHELRSERRFIGQFDELAIYDHALPAEAVARHYRVAGHRNTSVDGI